MKDISLKELMETGAHFGHQTTRWNPKMRPYIYTSRDRIHIFDLVKTKEGLEEAAAFTKASASVGGKIIFIGTKRQSQDIIKEAAGRAGMPYIVQRWVGGLITNWDSLKKRLEHLASLKSGKAEGKFKTLTKKENLLIDREIKKMELIFGGVADLTEIPAAIFVADARKDVSALKEAKMRGVKTIAIVDSNADPDFVDIVIPANDDATKSIQMITDILVEAILEGKKKVGEKQEVRSEKKTEDGTKEEKEKGESKPKEVKATKKTKVKKVTKETK